MKDEEGNPIVELPTKKVEIRYLEFGEEEKGIYENLNWVSFCFFDFDLFGERGVLDGIDVMKSSIRKENCRI